MPAETDFWQDHRLLAQPHGHADTALNVIIWTTWATFLIDYVARTPVKEKAIDVCE